MEAPRRATGGLPLSCPAALLLLLLLLQAKARVIGGLPSAPLLPSCPAAPLLLLLQSLVQHAELSLVCRRAVLDGAVVPQRAVVAHCCSCSCCCWLKKTGGSLSKALHSDKTLSTLMRCPFNVLSDRYTG
ncbi:hypothetical protein COO60DRAFT_1526077 [Scenedesmus sp. NREL 46B-D3]|nr:hypothetical protein COO60DRAFT_1526077 [Scenedesmus sp. NREL 46B-D3]